MNLQAFRRFPSRQIKGLRPKLGAQLLSALYDLVDRGGWLSDLIADPQTIYERVWFHRALRTLMRRRPLPSVSVIVATRDNADTIERSLHSLQIQRGVDLEIIVIDDCSSDSTGRIVSRLAEQDPRIRLIGNITHLGTGASRNRGLAVATRDYVTFQDGDDVSLAGRLSIQANTLANNAGAKICLCNYVRVNKRGQRMIINNGRIRKCIISMMFPRDAIISSVGFFLEKSLSEDSDYYQRIKLFFGKNCEIVVFRTLYEALFRSNSSFFASVQIEAISDAEISFTKLPEALRLAEEMEELHEQMKRGDISVFVPLRTV